MNKYYGLTGISDKAAEGDKCIIWYINQKKSTRYYKLFAIKSLLEDR